MATQYRKLSEPEKHEILSKEKYLEFLKDKIFEDQFLIEKAYELTKPQPGFVLSEKSPYIEPIDICGLCCQLVREPLSCASCSLRYCKSCAYFLVTILELNRGNRDKRPAINLVGQLFQCLTYSCERMTLLIQPNEVKNLENYMVKCIYSECNFIAKHDIMTKHCDTHCTLKSTDFKLDKDRIGSVFQHPEDPLTENYSCNRVAQRLQEEEIDIHGLRKEMLDGFCAITENMDISEQTEVPNLSRKRKSSLQEIWVSKRPKTSHKSMWDALLDKANKPVTTKAKEIQQPVPLPLDQPSTSAQSSINNEKSITSTKETQKNYPPKRTIADKRREARHRRKDRERGITVPLINNPDEEIDESLKSLTSEQPLPEYNFSTASSYAPDSKGPTPKVTVRRNDFKSETARENFYYRHRNSRRWNQKERSRKGRKNIEILHEKILKSAQDMLPPKEYTVEIAKAAVKAEKAGLKICAIDLENCRVKMKNGAIHQVPVWIAIVDASSKVVYHQLVRHPTSAIEDFGDKIHDLEKSETSKSKNFKTIRQEVINILRKYDRIIVCGQTGDFVSLFLTINDHLYLLPRIICVGSYYNTYQNNNALGLKYISYLLFNVELQKKFHSPLIDAAYTMYAYLIDFDRIEEVKRLLQGPKPISQGFHGFIYPPNQHMASLLMEKMKIVKDWPDSFKVSAYDHGATRLKKIKSQKFIPSQHIIPTPIEETPHPYKLTEFRKQSLLSSKLR